jgi:ATP-binding protein involved in chromosome partitioning
MPITPEAVFEALSRVQDPEIGKSLTEAQMVHDVSVEGDHVSLTIRLTTYVGTGKARIEADARAALVAVGAREVTIAWATKMTYRNIQEDDPCPQVANIVLVMSGKGGVGKSTVAANLTMALARRARGSACSTRTCTGRACPPCSA